MENGRECKVFKDRMKDSEKELSLRSGSERR